MDICKLKQCIDIYIKRLQSEKKSQHTVDSYRRTLMSFLKFMEESREDLTFKDAVMNFIYSLDGSLSINTLNSKRAALRSFIMHLYATGYIEENFAHVITKLKKNNHQTKEVLETKEIQKILNVLKEELSSAEGYNIYYKARNAILFNFLLYTGVRRSELVSIKWSDINLQKNKIQVLGKNNKIRVIPLKKELKYELMEYKELLKQFEEAGYEVFSEYIFRSEHRNPYTKKKDKPMTPRNVADIIKNLMIKAGIEKKITPHSLRHNFASYGIASGMNITSLSGILGHSSSDITMRIYAHEISEEERIKEMDKLDFGI